jgi:plasmid maintenance system killer protein
MKITYSPKFLTLFKKLEGNLKIEAKEKIKLFGQDPSHPFLKVHKLKGTDNRYSFSVNYRYRIVFMHLSKEEIVLLTIGDHDVYANLF